jgi:hypothetical protein
VHEEPADIAASLEPVGDLEYDLSHETIAPSDGSNGAETERDEQFIYVATETDDSGGDYGYDMAHDIPAP